MANYNSTILMGNLTADPEKRFTKDGSAVTNFTVAVNGPPSKDPDREDEVLFMPCVTFGKTAEAVGKYLSKGGPVLVDGRLRTDKWEQDGEKKSRTVLRVGLVQFLGRKGETSGEPEGASDGDVPF